MNNAQNEKLLEALGDAFDKAATTCGHQRQAALWIVYALARAGFRIIPKGR